MNFQQLHTWQLSLSSSYGLCYITLSTGVDMSTTQQTCSEFFGCFFPKNKRWNKLAPNSEHALPFAFSIFHLREIDLEMDTSSELINFNLIPPMHYYLHNATGSHSLCALNGNSTFKLCTEYKFSPLLHNKRQSFHLFSHTIACG